MLWSIRVRLTLAALVIVVATLAVGGASLVWLLHSSLTDGLVTSATTEAGNVGGLISQGPLPQELPVRSGTAVQVVNAEGVVVAASADLEGRKAVASVRPPVGALVPVPAGVPLPGDEHNGIAVATTVSTDKGNLTIYAVSSRDQAEDSVHDLELALAIVLPILVVVSTVLVWILAGRAMRPVESIRREVSDISVSDLHRRVPVPPVDDEIARLASTMNAMLSRLEAATDRQRQFVSDASHELRSPLATVITVLEVARARPDSADWPSVAATAEAEAGRLGQIVDNLLLLARSDEGQLVPGHEPVDLDELVLAEGERLRAQDRVAVDLRGVGAGRVLGDHEQLGRVLRNLADNAERHAAGTVTFEVNNTGDSVEVVVADDGPGIPEGERQRVFERFTRVDQARDRPAGGAGLGLAIVGEVVAAHGGSVVVADSAVGARVVVRLPAEPSDEP
jgi:signal transduction histidine kinase